MVLSAHLAKDVHLAIAHSHTDAFRCVATNNNYHFHEQEHEYRDCSFLHINITFDEVPVINFEAFQGATNQVEIPSKTEKFIPDQYHKHLYLRGPPIFG